MYFLTVLFFFWKENTHFYEYLLLLEYKKYLLS